MTLKHFRQRLQQQYRRLLIEGSYVAERSHEDVQVLLFQVAHFYTEIFFQNGTDEVLGCPQF